MPLLDGIEDTLEHLRQLPQAVVSQNERATIARILKDNRVDHYFTAIVGYAEVPLDRQKPAPDGLLNALDIIGIEEPATALYIGDHETDILCAVNTNRDLVAMGRDLPLSLGGGSLSQRPARRRLVGGARLPRLSPERNQLNLSTISA